MNLLTEKWLSIVRKDGTREKISPAEITNNLKDNPVVDFDSPRADFNGALWQFMIGLLQTAMTPEGEDEWAKYFNKPPSQKVLSEKFQPYEKAFEFSSSAPSFMQDYEMLCDATLKDEKDISQLLIEAPGENTIKQNTDHFVKRGLVTKLCEHCSALALFTMQTNAPSGGSGHRTSMRGGGPITSLIKQKELISLWHNIWLNILLEEDVALIHESNKKGLKAIFPWLSATITSEKKDSITTPSKVHPFHTYWAMPRRFCLIQGSEEKQDCSICNEKNVKVYSEYYTVNYGYNYEGFKHPLSPYYRDKDKNLLPLHLKPSGFIYKMWPDLSIGNTAGGEASLNIRTLKKKEDEVEDTDCSIFAFGYDMDNMKARSWYEASFQLWKVEEKAKEKIYDFSSQLASITSEATSLIRKYIKLILIGDGPSKGDLSSYENQLWQNTENDYFDYLSKYIKLLEIKDQEQRVQDIQKLKREWLDLIKKESIKIVDNLIEASGSDILMKHVGIGEKSKTVAEIRIEFKRFLGSKRMKSILSLQEKQK